MRMFMNEHKQWINKILQFNGILLWSYMLYGWSVYIWWKLLYSKSNAVWMFRIGGIQVREKKWNQEEVEVRVKEEEERKLNGNVKSLHNLRFCDKVYSIVEWHATVYIVHLNEEATDLTIIIQISTTTWYAVEVDEQNIQHTLQFKLQQQRVCE